MSRRQFRSFVFLLLLAIVSGGCSVSAPRKPSVVILSPPLGSQYSAGDSVTIQAVATDASGIARVDMYVDGAVVHSDAPPRPMQSFSVTQTWRANGGSHSISVRAVNTSGTSSDPATVQVAVEGNSAPAAAPTAIAGPLSPTPPFVPPAGSPCSDDAAFITDVTVPDGTVLAPRQSFGKIWRVRNTGSCAWGQGYQLVLIGGTVFSGPTAVNIPGAAPGATSDVTVTLSAPERAGTFTSMWRLRNPSGSLFGVTLTVTIRVGTGTSSSGCSGVPNIESFGASPTTINAGQPVTLSWGFVSNADSAEIDNDIDGIATPGSTTVRPTETTTYTLTAFCGSRSISRQVTIKVNPAPTPNQPAATLNPPTPTKATPTVTPLPPTVAPSPSPTGGAGKLN